MTRFSERNLNETERLRHLITIMSVVVLLVSGATFYQLYRTAIQEETDWLANAAQSQARLIEAVARFDTIYSNDYPEGSRLATLSQIRESHQHYKGFGRTGEFVLGKKAGGNIEFLLRHRHYDLDKPKPVPFESDWAEPMRRALLGKSGTLVGLDYRGETVLAAHEPVAILNLGIVAKMDLSEIRAPFIRAGFISAVIAVFFIILGSIFLIRVTNPLFASLKSSEEQVRLLLNSTAEAIFGLDPQGNFAFVNSSCLSMLGYEDKGQVIGKKMNELFQFTRQGENITEKEDSNIFQAICEGKECHCDNEILLKADGTSFPVEYWAFPMRKNGLFTGTVVTFVDITERKLAEEELKKAKEAAENATKLKDKFVFLVAHNLKNPFTSIQGFLQLILRDQLEPVPEKHAEKLRRIHQSCIKLHTMLEELLNMSRIHSGAIRPIFKFLDVRTVIDNAIENHVGLAQKKGIQLVNMAPEGTRLYADPRLLEEVVANLVSNAIKFCTEGDEITVFLPPNPKASIGVKDTGTGIKKELLPNLFKEEVKTTSVGTDGEKGTGLGLPYSSQIMKALGGKLFVESTEEKGSVFYAQLPDVKPRILIVDDHEEIRKLISIFLTTLDVQISEAGSGREGLDILEQFTPHVIITDITMPEMDGFEFLTRIKQDPNSKDIPVIVITSDKEMQIREKSFRLGASDFMSKPLTMEEIIPRVKRHIG